jgi:hypothetical protein
MSDSLNKQSLDPMSVFMLARKNGWKGHMISDVTGRSGAAISKAFSGKLPTLLILINKIVVNPVPARIKKITADQVIKKRRTIDRKKINQRLHPNYHFKPHLKPSKRGVDFSQPLRIDQ